ncbi:uncharacterized protein AB9W97_001569 isoform 2-T2 [Spinachia spinachia]
MVLCVSVGRAAVFTHRVSLTNAVVGPCSEGRRVWKGRRRELGNLHKTNTDGENQHELTGVVQAQRCRPDAIRFIYSHVDCAAKRLVFLSLFTLEILVWFETALILLVTCSFLVHSWRELLALSPLPKLKLSRHPDRTGRVETPGTRRPKLSHLPVILFEDQRLKSPRDQLVTAVCSLLLHVLEATANRPYQLTASTAGSPCRCPKPGKPHPHQATLEMNSIMSLGAPLKQFTTGVSEKRTSTKRGAKGSQSVRRSSFTRRKSVSRRRSLPCSNQKVPDSWLRLYQDDLQRERKRQQAILAKKNAERTVRKTHFRSHHCLPRTSTARKPAPVKDESFFGAFQGLSLDGLLGDGHGSPSVSVPAVNGDQCNVM